MAAGWVPGIALPAHPAGTPPRVHPSPPHPVPTTAAPVDPGYKVAVGLISVAQLSLWAHFSEIEGITEVYNLLITRRINNHFLISQNK